MIDLYVPTCINLYFIFYPIWYLFQYLQWALLKIEQILGDVG